MANRRTTAALVIACLFVAVTLADALPEPPRQPQPQPQLTCSNAYGVQEQETCFAVAQAAGLTLTQFLGFNPNINCRRLFVGQWVCLNATTAS